MKKNTSQSSEALAVAELVLQQCAGARLRTMNRVVTKIYDAHLRSLDVRFSQLNILMMITGRGPISSGQIGEIFHLEKSTLSRNLRVLEKSGWIRQHDGEPKNRVQYVATEAGYRLICDAKPHWQKAQAEVADLLGQKGIEAIHSAFNNLS